MTTAPVPVGTRVSPGHQHRHPAQRGLLLGDPPGVPGHTGLPGRRLSHGRVRPGSHHSLGPCGSHATSPPGSSLRRSVVPMKIA